MRFIFEMHESNDASLKRCVGCMPVLQSLSLWPTVSGSCGFICASGDSRRTEPAALLSEHYAVVLMDFLDTAKTSLHFLNWLSGCEEFTWQSRRALKEKPNCSLLWPLALKWSLFYDSVVLFISPCRSHAPSRTTHNMPGYDTRTQSVNNWQLTLALTETKFTWHWSRWKCDMCVGVLIEGIKKYKITKGS